MKETKLDDLIEWEWYWFVYGPVRDGDATIYYIKRPFECSECYEKSLSIKDVKDFWDGEVRFFGPIPRPTP